MCTETHTHHRSSLRTSLSCQVHEHTNTHTPSCEHFQYIFTPLQHKHASLHSPAQTHKLENKDKPPRIHFKLCCFKINYPAQGYIFTQSEKSPRINAPIKKSVSELKHNIPQKNQHLQPEPRSRAVESKITGAAEAEYSRHTPNV